MQAGEEMLRSKLKAGGTYDENSYKSPDSVNSIKWSTLEETEYQDVYEYYKGLIAFRKAHAALRLTNAEDVKQNVTPVDGLPANVVALSINGGVNGEASDGIFVIFNPNNQVEEIPLPEGVWDVFVNGEKAGTEVLATIADGKASVEPISAMVLVRSTAAPSAAGAESAAQESPAATESASAEAADVSSASGNSAGILIGVAAVAAAAGGIAFAAKKKKLTKAAAVQTHITPHKPRSA